MPPGVAAVVAKERIGLERALHFLDAVDHGGVVPAAEMLADAGATVITPNRAELAQVVGSWSGEAELETRARGVRERFGLAGLLFAMLYPFLVRDYKTAALPARDAAVGAERHGPAVHPEDAGSPVAVEIGPL